MIRYHIVDRDTTNARGGGAVVASAHNDMLMGRAQALIGDDVICNECGEIGKISPHGPRLRETVNGREVALNGDLCLCNCSPTPQLINSQTMSKQIIDVDEVVAPGYVPSADSDVPQEKSDQQFDRHFRFIDETGTPVNGIRVYLIDFSGKASCVVTDDDGRTPIVAGNVGQQIGVRLQGEKQ